MFLYDVVEHLENPLKALREIYEVLIEGGILELGTPNALFILKVARAVKRGFYSPHENHIATYGLPELKSLLERARFKQVNIRYATYLDYSYRSIERLILFLCRFRALRNRQLLAEARK